MVQYSNGRSMCHTYDRSSIYGVLLWFKLNLGFVSALLRLRASQQGDGNLGGLKMTG